MTITSGQSIGRYHILEPLGEGGMATVFKAHDTQLDRPVALKVIRAEQVEDAAFLKRFEREARALAQLAHPHIVKVYDYGEHEGEPYIVMEYLPGGTLKQKTGKPLPYPEATRLLAPIASALAYAHGRSIIHRDVKPVNILLKAGGEPTLSDFGIAKILETTQTQELTASGVGIGTPEYMAPEQWMGKAVPQTDIYALGIIFYELVTGRRPYTADTPAAVLLKQATDPLPRPSSINPVLPEEVERVIFKALAKDVKERYASAAEFGAALERLAGGAIASADDLPSLSSLPTLPSTGETGMQKLLSRAEQALANEDWSQAYRIAAELAVYGEAGQTETDRLNKRIAEARRKATQPPAAAVRHKGVPGWVWGIGLALVTLAAAGVLLLVIRPGVEKQVPTATPQAIVRPGAIPPSPIAASPIPTQVLATVAPFMPVAASGEVISSQNIERLVELKHFGNGTLQNFTWSEDGRQLRMVTSIGIVLVNAQTMEIDNSYVPEPGAWHYESNLDQQMAISDDGNWLAFPGARDAFSQLTNEVRVWDLSKGTALGQVDLSAEAERADVATFTFLPDHRTLLVIVENYNRTGDFKAIWWDFQEKKVVRRVPLEGLAASDKITFVYAGDGQSLILGKLDWEKCTSQVVANDAQNGKMLKSIPALKVRLQGGGGNCDYSTLHYRAASDARALAVWTDNDNHVMVVNPSDLSVIKTVAGDGNKTRGIDISSDGQYLAGSFYTDNNHKTTSRMVELFDLSKGKKVQRWDMDTWVWSPRLSPDGKTLAVSSYDLQVKLYDTGSGAEIKTWNRSMSNGSSYVSFSPEGRLLALVGKKVIDLLDDGKEISVLENYDKYDGVPVFSQDGSIVSLQHAPDGPLAVNFDLKSGKLLPALPAIGKLSPRSDYWDIVLSPDGSKLAAWTFITNLTTLDQTSVMHIWDTHSAKKEKQIDEVWSVAYFPDSQKMFVQFRTSEFKPGIYQGDQLLKTINFSMALLSDMLVSGDSKTLATSDWQGRVILFDLESGQNKQFTQDYKTRINARAFSPDSRLFVVGMEDASIKVMEVATGKEVASLPAHTARISSISFSPDGRQLATSSQDGVTWLWGVPPE